MTLKIDKFGRITLPKPIRDRLGLHEGSELEIIENPDGVMLRPIERGPSMIKKQGLWVHTGKLPSEFEEQLQSGRDFMKEYRETFKALAK